MCRENVSWISTINFIRGLKLFALPIITLYMVGLHIEAFYKEIL